jgi:SAM-dependent methyltransferase
VSKPVRPFALHYDDLYSDKDYDGDFLVLTQLHAPAELLQARLLEIGAGTGNHTIRLAPMVRELTSLEIDVDFAKLAQRKAASFANAMVVTGDLQTLDAGPYDGAVAFFNVLNYVPAERIDGFLSALSTRLRPGGWLLADLWNGKVVLGDPPRSEVRRKSIHDLDLSQAIRPELDPVARCVTLNYEIDVRGRIARHFTEQIRMYLHMLDELQFALEQRGFTHIRTYDRRHFPANATDKSWHVWLSASKER